MNQTIELLVKVEIEFINENEMRELSGAGQDVDAEGWYIIYNGSTEDGHDGCGAKTGWAPSQEEALKKWNERKTV